jgi:PAS domain S-box-containing protein
MKDKNKTKTQLIAELEEIRSRISRLEQSETEQMRVEKKLRENEKLLRTIAENHPNSYLSIIHKDFTVGFTSGQGFIKQSLDPEQFVGLTLEQVFGDKAVVVREHYQKTFQGEEQSFELFINEQHQYYRTVPLYADDGTISRILIVAENITERKKMEEALKESEEKYRTLYDNAPLAYQSLNESGHFIDVNPMWLSMLGYKREEVIGAYFGDFLHTNWKLQFEKNFAAFKKRGYVHDVRFKIQHKEGHHLDISFEGCIGYHSDGRFKQTYCVFQDISDRARAEQEILRTKILLESSIESPKDMIILSLDHEYRYLYFNKAHEETMIHIYGSQPQIGEYIFDYMKREDDIEQVKAHYDRALAGEGHTAIEEYGEGDLRYYYEIHYNPIYDEQKEIIGITSFAKNISDRKQAEKNIRYRFDLEKLANEISTMFVNTEFAEIDDAITSALEKIAQFSNANRSSLFLLSNGMETLTNTHEWCEDPEDSQISLIQDIPFLTFGYYREELLLHKPISISNIDDLPLDAMGEREWIRDYGFRALLFIPLIKDKVLIGTLGFYGEINMEIYWPPDFVNMLKTTGNLILNVLERKRVEQALKDSEEQYRILYENVPVGIGVTKLNGIIVRVNDYLLKLGGYTLEDILEIGGIENFYVNQMKREEVITIFQQQGFVDKFEVDFKRRNDTNFTALLSLIPIHINGELQIQAVVDDITKQKQAEVLLQEAYDTLEERVEDRTNDLSLMLDSMAGREVRMAELKKVIKKLRKQLGEAGLKPVADDPLISAEDGY